MRVGFALDPHLSSHNPSGRVDDYAAACLDKMEQFRMLARTRMWQGAVFAGDLFNLSSVARWFETEIIGILKGFPCPVYAIAGNHDLKARRVSAIDEVILGSFFKAGVVKNLVESGIDFPPSAVAGTPGSSVVGMHFMSEPDGQVPEATAPNSWLVCHQYLGDEAGPETLSYGEIRERGYVGVVAGHEHNDTGTVTLSGLTVIRCGSMLRKENAEFNFRQPRIAEVNFPSNEVVLHELRAAEPSAVFATKQVGLDPEEVFDTDRLRAFATSLENRDFAEDATEVDLLDKLVEDRGLIVGSEVHACLAGYFEKNGLR